MTDFTEHQIALSLLQADSESDVIAILRKHDLWDEPKNWRLERLDSEGHDATSHCLESLPMIRQVTCHRKSGWTNRSGRPSRFGEVAYSG